jgi:hypothetical protein
MVEVACESDIDRVAGNSLNPASDSLAIERGALSAGLALLAVQNCELRSWVVKAAAGHWHNGREV